MKKSFLFGILLFMSSLGFCQNNDWTISVTIQVPNQINNEIICYCLEYCDARYVDIDTAWKRMYVNNGDVYSDQTYVINELLSNTCYIIRAHAYYWAYDEENRCYYGEYGKFGPEIVVRTTEEAGNVDAIVICGPLSPLTEWHPENVNESSSRIAMLERTLYRTKEEWEQLS